MYRGFFWTCAAVAALTLLMAFSSADAALIGHYPLDTVVGGTTTPDTTGVNGDGTLNGNIITDVGKIGGGLGIFAGSGNFVGINDPGFGQTAFTASVWFRADTINNGDPIANWTNAGPSPRTFLIRSNGGVLQTFVRENGATQIGGTANFPTQALTTADFNHAVITYDGQSLRTYLNGELSPDVASFGSPRPIGQGVQGTAAIGGRGSSEQNMNGLVDDVAFWNETLTNGKVAAIYNLGNLSVDAGQANQLFEVFDGTTSTANVAGQTWRRDTRVVGNPGDILDIGNGNFFVNLDGNSGVSTASGPAMNEFRIDIDSTQGGAALTTEPGFTSLNVGGGGTGNVTVDGTTFTTFSADGSRNRAGAPNALTSDFIFDDGAGQASGVTVNNLPAGIYRANVYAFDQGAVAGDQIVGITRFANGPETIYTDSFTANPTDPFSFVFSTDQFPDGSGIFTRENNANDRSRFNAVELVQLDLVPSNTQFQIDIDSTQGGQPQVTQPGWTALNAGDGATGSVTEDGVTFTIFSADGSRNRDSMPNPLLADFVFDDGDGQAVGVTLDGLPDGIWEASVFAYDDDFEVGELIVGITQFANGPEIIFTDSYTANPNTPFSFIFDSTALADGFGIFTRENNVNLRARFNGLQLTLLEEAGVPEPASMTLLALGGLALIRRRRREEI